MAPTAPAASTAVSPASAPAPTGPGNVGAGVSTTPAGGPGAGGGPGGAPAAAASTGGALLGPAMENVRNVGASGATGNALFAEAEAASRAVVETIIGQTRRVGYIGMQYAVAVVWGRDGVASTWLATGEGPGYIPPGVRIPDGVKSVFADPIHGAALRTHYAGGGDPVEMVAQHAQLRGKSGMGGKMLTIASTLPVDRIEQWAGQFGATPVSVNFQSVDPRTFGEGVHRAAVANEWDWQYANSLDEQGRNVIRQRHMLMACNATGMYTNAMNTVLDQVQRENEVPADVWKQVERDWNMAVSKYQQVAGNSSGGPEAAHAFVQARAVETVMFVRNALTAQGCADLLYSARMAGAAAQPARATA